MTKSKIAKTVHNHFYEPHAENANVRLNWLRAAVLGANDGIVSIAGLVVGVAGATSSRSAVLTAGVAGIVAGAISMAAGEYVSVSAQRDSERSMLEKERRELAESPDEELEELIGLYEEKGLSHSTAALVAAELTEKDSFAAHVDAELNIDPNNLTNPWHAAGASALAFIAGALIPLVAVALPSQSARVPVTFISVVAALAITGSLSAWIGKASMRKATIRVLTGGILAMIVTYYVGHLFGSVL